MACSTASSVIKPDSAAKTAQQHRIRQGPAQQAQGNVGGRHGDQALVAKALADVCQTEFVKAAPGVDQHIAIGFETLEHIDLMQQRGVLHDQHIGRHDGFAQADLLVVDAAKGHHRGARALGAKAGKGLRVSALLKGGQRQHFGRGHHPLTAAPMDTDLQHACLPLFLKRRMSAFCASAPAIY